MTTPAHVRYYQHNHGCWRCSFAFRVTDWSAFRATPMRLRDRLQVLAMALVPKVVGPLEFATEVDAHRIPGVVLHFTWVRKWGVPLFIGREQLTLEDDGQTVTFSGTRWALPFPREPLVGAWGTVDADGRTADYRFPWFGTVIEQRGVIVEDGCDLHQRTPWFEGVQRLRRA